MGHYYISLAIFDYFEKGGEYFLNFIHSNFAFLIKQISVIFTVLFVLSEKVAYATNFRIICNNLQDLLT